MATGQTGDPLNVRALSLEQLAESERDPGHLSKRYPTRSLFIAKTK